MEIAKDQVKDNSLFAFICLLNGKEVKIYSYMPVLRLKQLVEQYKALAAEIRLFNENKTIIA